MSDSLAQIDAGDPLDLNRFVQAQAGIYTSALSEMTLFDCVAGAGSVFSLALDKYFAGERDSRTLGLIALQRPWPCGF
jgi:uncharacterized protein (DUF1810 family)